MRKQARTGWGFGLLCVLAGSGWLWDEWRPPALTGLAQATVHLAGLAVVFGFVAWRRRPRGEAGGWSRIAGWGAALWGLPLIVAAGAGGEVGTFTQVLAYGLVPVMVIVGVAAGEGSLRLLPAALAGLAGMGLLLPLSAPATTMGWVWLAVTLACAVAVAAAAVRLHELLAGTDVWKAAAIVCGVSAVVTGVCGRVGWMGVGAWDWKGASAEAARCVVLDGPVVLLTVWALREMAPVRAAARYLLIPLVTVVEGYVVLRPAMTWSLAAGLALLAGGGLGLIWADQEENRQEL